MARTSQRGRNNNNADGRNQYNGGWMDSARDKPFTTAAAAAAAVGAGVFLWSRRYQISDQISNLSEQIGDWSHSMRSNRREDGEELALAEADTGTFESASRKSAASGNRGSASRKSSSGRSARGMSETGGGNASLGAHSGSTGTGAAS